MNRVKSGTNPVIQILTEATSFPYLKTTLGRDITGISIVNDHATVAVTAVIIANGVTYTINCTQYNRNYTADFEDITSINVTAGTTYQIEVRGI